MLIAHDLGTSGNKASLHSATGELLASATVHYPVHFADGGVAEQNPEDWWDAVVAATRELLARTGVRPSEVTGLVVSGQMMGAVLLDAAYRPVRPAIIWADTRSRPQTETLERRFGQRAAFGVLGNRLDPTYTLPKLMWVRDNEPEAWQAVRHFGFAKDYIVLRLTGRLLTDHSDASGSAAYDLVADTWWEEIIEAAGIPLAIFPEIVDSTEVVGTLSAPAAATLGLAEATRVVMGGGDGPTAAVGAGVVAVNDPPFVCLGTSSWISFATARPAVDDRLRVFSFRHLVPGLFVPTATMQAGGASLSWIAEVVGGPEDSLEGLLAQAGEATAAEDGLFFLPHLLGERSPYFNPEAAGAFVGLRRHHTRGQLVRAVLEGVGFNLRLCLDAFADAGLTAPTIDAIGGGAASDVWLRLLADLWGMTVRRRTVVEEANSLGAAVTAAVGLGLSADFSPARSLSRISRQFSPDAGRATTYRGALEVFRDAYRQLEPWYPRRFPASGGRA